MVVIALENRTIKNGQYRNFPGRWLLRPAFHAGIKPCDVIMCKVYYWPPFDVFVAKFLWIEVFNAVEALTGNTLKQIWLGKDVILYEVPEVTRDTPRTCYCVNVSLQCNAVYTIH
jgi:hypothetical protein